MWDYLVLLFNIFIFPGFLFCFLIGLLLLGIDRKIVARIQRRIGPPIIQPFYDFFKLVGKERIVPSTAARRVYLLAPVIGLLSVITISLFIPINQFRVFKTDIADIIVVLYLLAIPALAVIMGGASSGSPFAGIGASREVVLMLGYELPLVIVLLTVGWKVGMMTDGSITFSLARIVEYQLQNGPAVSLWPLIPAALAFIMIIPCEIGTTPFDIAEAETEICEGPMVEYGGISLGLYKLTQGIKIFIMVSLFIALFASGIVPVSITPNVFLNTVINILIHVVFVIVIVFIVISMLRAVTARIRVEQAFKFYWTYPTLLSVVSLILVWAGL
jgi:NADH-quinone oxidoreductase subunit H